MDMHIHAHTHNNNEKKGVAPRALVRVLAGMCRQWFLFDKTEVRKGGERIKTEHIGKIDRAYVGEGDMRVPRKHSRSTCV